MKGRVVVACNYSNAIINIDDRHRDWCCEHGNSIHCGKFWKAKRFESEKPNVARMVSGEKWMRPQMFCEIEIVSVSASSLQSQTKPEVDSLAGFSHPSRIPFVQH